MKKYDPDESITCPKCGRKFAQAEVMNVTYLPGFASSPSPSPSYLRLTCLCGLWFERLPLDHKEY